MLCPFCGTDSSVGDSRITSDGGVRRRRICNSCKRRFTTYEIVGSPNLKVLKRNTKLEPFSSDKLRTCLSRVCRKRPAVLAKDLTRIARAIEAQIIDSGAKTIHSSQIADLILERLAEIDRLATDRFAANYIDEAGNLRTTVSTDDANNEQLGLFVPTKKE